MTAAENYVAVAYLVVFVLVVACVVIIGAKLQRLERAGQDFSVVRDDVQNEPELDEPMRPAVSERGHSCSNDRATGTASRRRRPPAAARTGR